MNSKQTGERRVSLSESELRKMIRTVWDEAFSDGESNGISESHYSSTAWGSSEMRWQYSDAREAVENLINVDRKNDV